MVLHRVLPFVALPLLAVPAVSIAEEAVPPSTDVSSVVFPSMGADGAASQLGAQLLFMTGDGDSLERIDLEGQYMSPRGAGGYAAVGLTTIDDRSSLRSLEVGALLRQEHEQTAITFRAGLVLPTGSSDDGDLLLNLISAMYSRPSDYLRGATEVTTLRLAASPQITSGSFIGRADLGLDIPVAGDGVEPFDDLFAHVDLGAGVRNAKAAALVELTTMAYLHEPEELLHLVAVTGELYAGRATPYVTIAKPFQTGDEEGEGIFGLDITNIAFGVRGRL